MAQLLAANDVTEEQVDELKDELAAIQAQLERERAARRQMESQVERLHEAGNDERVSELEKVREKLRDIERVQVDG